LSNILLTPFDKEMRQKGYRLTRWADDWVVTCRTRAEGEHALARAGRILETLGVTLNREKTRIVHIAQGFEFLGFKIGRGNDIAHAPLRSINGVDADYRLLIDLRGFQVTGNSDPPPRWLRKGRFKASLYHPPSLSFRYTQGTAGTRILSFVQD
jgi:hypothetical protein